jgi:hypothetical protein
MALQIVPLFTPLQPQTSALSALRGLVVASRIHVADVDSQTSLVAGSPPRFAFAQQFEVVVPSTVSPYRQAPTSTSSLMTSFR